MCGEHLYRDIMKCNWIPFNMMLLFFVDIHGTTGEMQTHNLLSCRFFNHSQLHYHCSEPNWKQSPSPVTIHDLNTFEVVEELCGNYKGS